MLVLKVDDLKVSFPSPEGDVSVVRGVSLELCAGETLAVVGESGSGKSVTSLALMGLLPEGAHIEGNFRFQGRDFRPEDGGKRGRGMSMVFQNPMSSLNPVMKIGEQVSEPLRYLLKMSREQARKRVLELFAEVGLPCEEEFFHHYPHQLSGGMRQRVMIAIALACSPEVLIADEPTTALDVTVQAQILALLKNLQRSHRMALLIVTHDMGVVKSVADRVAVMYAGQFVEVGGREAVMEEPKHPYTEALLRSIPQLTPQVPRKLESIPGRPPAPTELASGCPFAPRCSRVEPDCSECAPELLEIGDRAVRCLLVGGV